MAEIQILGSAAAESIPAVFCSCPICTAAWENGGKDMRMRTAYKISDRVRVDYGPDSLAQEHKFQLHSEKLRHLFITHSHEDHLYPDLLAYRKPGFSVVPETDILNVYGNPGVIRVIQQHFWAKGYEWFDGDFGLFRMKPVQIEAFVPIELQEDDMTFIPLPADHFYVHTEKPNIYAFRVGKSFGLIANDTGYFPEDTWKYLEEKKIPFDLVISDCTGGLKDIKNGHMSGAYMLEVKQRLENIGCVIPGKTQYVINHFSHNGRATHAQLEEHYAPYGIQVGYDGMKLEF